MTDNKLSLHLQAIQSPDLQKALDDLKAALDELPYSSREALQRVLDASKLVCLETDESSTASGQLSVSIYPTDLLLILPAVLRANMLGARRSQF